MAEFTLPEFLQNCSADEIHAFMKAILPADLDVSEGGHAFNMTKPTALIAAEMLEYFAPEIIKLIFPEWSYGAYLDGHAKGRSIVRRAATAASGEITITGKSNTVIPAGSLFSTAAVNDEPSVDYRVTATAVIPESGSVKVPVQCTQTGIVGNTTAGTIVLVASRNTGITAVVNEKAITGGTEAEDDESLIARILEYDRNLGNSFTGSPADYKRWALEVDGVGDASVISAQDDSGLVRIIITDSNGDPANETLCTAVYDHIMVPNSEGERLAPINAYLSVEPPATIAISIKATVELADGATIDAVKTAYMARLAAYLPEAMEAKEIKYSRVGAALSATEGVNDYADILIGVKDGDTVTYGAANIAVTAAQLPAIAADDLILTTGTV